MPSISDHIVQKGNIIYTFTMTASEQHGNPDDPGEVTGFVNEETLMWTIPTDRRSEGAATITPWLIREKDLKADYDKWKAGLGELALAGTSLEAWAPIQANPAAMQNLMARGIKTVEQLAAIDEGVLASFGQSLRPLRDAAVAFTRKDDGAEVKALQDTVAKLMAEVEAMRAGKTVAETAVTSPSSDDDKALILEMIKNAGGKPDARKSIETLRTELANLQGKSAT